MRHLISANCVNFTVTYLLICTWPCMYMLCVSLCVHTHAFASVLGLCLYECMSELVFQIASQPSPPFFLRYTFSLILEFFSCLGYLPIKPLASVCLHTSTWGGRRGMWTQVLGLVQQTLYPLSHVPAPRNPILRYLTLNIQQVSEPNHHCFPTSV